MVKMASISLGETPSGRWNDLPKYLYTTFWSFSCWNSLLSARYEVVYALFIIDPRGLQALAPIFAASFSLSLVLNETAMSLCQWAEWKRKMWVLYWGDESVGQVSPSVSQVGRSKKLAFPFILQYWDGFLELLSHINIYTYRLYRVSIETFCWRPPLLPVHTLLCLFPSLPHRPPLTGCRLLHHGRLHLWRAGEGEQ